MPLLLTDDKFNYTPRTPLSAQQRDAITAKLFKLSPPVYFKPTQTRYQLCEHCYKPLPVSEKRYCRPCERMVIEIMHAAAFKSETARELKALALGAAVGGWVILMMMYFTR